MRKSTKVVPDLDQVRSTIDTIECPHCGKVQPARTYDLKGEGTMTHIHLCVCCHNTIRKAAWKSVAALND